jgi:hypothetical protein
MSGGRGVVHKTHLTPAPKLMQKLLILKKNEPSGYSRAPKSLRSRSRNYRIKGMCIAAFHRLIQCETQKTSLLYLRP